MYADYDLGDISMVLDWNRVPTDLFSLLFYAVSMDILEPEKFSRIPGIVGFIFCYLAYRTDKERFLTEKEHEIFINKMIEISEEKFLEIQKRFLKELQDQIEVDAFLNRSSLQREMIDTLKKVNDKWK